MEKLKLLFEEDFKKMSSSDQKKLETFIQVYTDDTDIFYSSSPSLNQFRYLFSKYPKLVHEIIKKNVKAAWLILEGVATVDQIKRMVARDKFKEFIDVCNGDISRHIIDLAHKAHSTYRLSESDFSYILINLKELASVKRRTKQTTESEYYGFFTFYMYLYPDTIPLFKFKFGAAFSNIMGGIFL